ncbi:MAG: hypothetical protein GY869_10250 [Planctomycetes bacterium]|nr:hypothetical protein [Planctomycetota bacterium]
MTPNEQNQNYDLLDKAIQTLRETDIPAEPPFEAVHAVLDAAPDNPRFLHRSFLSHHLNSITKIAAVLIFSLGGLSLLNWMQSLDNPQTQYAGIVEPLLNAQTTTCQVTVNTVGIPEQTYSTQFKAPGLIRHSVEGGAVQIVDFTQGKMLTLTPARLIAVELEMASPLQKQGHLLEIKKAIQQTLQDDSSIVHFVEEKKIDDQTLLAYRVSHSQMDITLWADADTLQLIQLEAISNAMNSIEKIVISDFDFNAPLDDTLFSFDVPNYYTAITLPDPTEDLTAFWTKIKNLSGQQFTNPQHLTTIMGYINPFRNQIIDPTNNQQLFQMPIMIPVMKRLLFL